MTRSFWKDQQAASFLAIAGGLLFWWAYGIFKGGLFALAIMLISQPPIWWAHRRD